MISPVQMFCAAVLILGYMNAAQAQALKIVEKLATSAARPGGKQLAKGGVGIVLRESDDAAKLLARRTAPLADDVLTTRFNRLSGVDDTLRAEFRALAPAEKRLVVELGEGVQIALRRYPEDGLALIQKLDAGGLAQARTYGDFVLDGAHWLHTDDVAKALGAAKLMPEEASTLSRALGLKALPETLQPEHVAPLWKSVIRKTGEGSAVFWRTYIQPHKGKWLAGGLLATYLIMPEKFHDAAGNLTEYAARQLAELGIAVSSGAVRGVIWGPLAAFKSRYADDPLTTILGTILIVSLLLLAIPPIRRFAWRRLIRPIWTGSPPPENKASGFTTHQPFRE